MIPQARKPRLLVVEDNPADIELLRLALNKANQDCELTVLSDGGEALDYLAKNGPYAGAKVPELAILDLNLPRHDGVEVLSAMRGNPEFDTVTIAVLTSSSWEREKPRLEGLRVDCFLMKPSDLGEYMQIGQVIKRLLTARDETS